MRISVLKKIRKRYNYVILSKTNVASRELGVTVYQVTDRKADRRGGKHVETFWGYHSFVFSALVNIYGLSTALKYDKRYGK